jgi:hypothetical protein
MFYLRFTLDSFLVRIVTRGALCLEDNVAMTSTPYLHPILISLLTRWHEHLGHPALQIVERVLEVLISLSSKSQLNMVFVALANRQRVINFHILNMLACPIIL